ncbi:MAG: pilus assembly protein PilM [Verrucomicrobiota bacterium]
MALPFISRSTKRDQLISIDLGARTTKAVCLQRKPEGYVLLGYAIMDALIYEKSLSVELLADHLKSVWQALNTKTKYVILSLSLADSVVRHAELPQVPVSDMRQIVKNNPKNYLQQELPGHVFDCCVIPQRPGAKPAEKPKPGMPVKDRVLVAGAKKQTVDDVYASIKAAGLIPEAIAPGLLGPVNAFELSLPATFTTEVVALVDIGFKSTSICILQEGELALSRVVGIGGDKLTLGLSESLGVSYAEAEGIKVGMPTDVQTNLEGLVLPLGRELRASIDFFEHQQDKAITKVYISGATSRSDVIVQMLQAELMVECKPWNPLVSLQFALPPEQVGDIENVSTQLTVAIGAAAALL